jgi:hypothetical protein
VVELMVMATVMVMKVAEVMASHWCVNSSIELKHE